MRPLTTSQFTDPANAAPRSPVGPRIDAGSRRPAPPPSRPAARRRLGRVWLGIVALGVLGVVAVFAHRFHAYVFGYVPTEWNVRSGRTGDPTYYYLDWRRDWRDRDALRHAAAEGPIETPLMTPWGDRVRHDPIIIIQAGLSLHDLALEAREEGRPDPELERILRNQLDWLTGPGVRRLASGVPVWPCYWEADAYGLRGPWISAMSQGQALSLLTRSAILFDEPAYLDFASDAVRAFFDPELPIVWHDETGDDLFLEEYPTRPPSHVLNGALCAWLGLWDYVRTTGDPQVRDLAGRALASIEERIGDFEIGDWTRYDALQDRPTSPNYQEIHASLAEALAFITESPGWEDRATRWRRAADDPIRKSVVFFEVLGFKLRNRIQPESPILRPADGAVLRPDTSGDSTR